MTPKYYLKATNRFAMGAWSVMEFHLQATNELNEMATLDVSMKFRNGSNVKDIKTELQKVLDSLKGLS